MWPNAEEISGCLASRPELVNYDDGLRPYSPLHKVHLYLPYNGTFFLRFESYRIPSYG